MAWAKRLHDWLIIGSMMAGIASAVFAATSLWLLVTSEGSSENALEPVLVMSVIQQGPDRLELSSEQVQALNPPSAESGMSPSFQVEGNIAEHAIVPLNEDHQSMLPSVAVQHQRTDEFFFENFSLQEASVSEIPLTDSQFIFENSHSPER